jgi:hypothetical protein
MPTEDRDVDLDVLVDWVDMVMVGSNDLFVFFARESGRRNRGPLRCAFAALGGFLASFDLIEVGNCIWSAPPRVGWLIDPRMRVSFQLRYGTLVPWLSSMLSLPLTHFAHDERAYLRPKFRPARHRSL